MFAYKVTSSSQAKKLAEESESVSEDVDNVSNIDKNNVEQQHFLVKIFVFNLINVINNSNWPQITQLRNNHYSGQDN